MAAISLSKLNKHYGSLFHAVKDVDLEIADREFVALVGPSGCGKSTTLRMIAGLEDITSGDIRIGNKVVNHLPPSLHAASFSSRPSTLMPWVAHKISVE